MSIELVNRAFASGVGTWSGQSPDHDVAQAGYDLVPGVARFTTPGTSVLEFQQTTSGVVSLEFDVYVGDSVTTGASGSDDVIYLTRRGGGADSSLAALALFLYRDTREGATADLVSIGLRVGGAFSVHTTVRRRAWYTIRVDADLNTKNYALYIDGILRDPEVAFANASIADFGEVVVLHQAGDISLDNIRVTAGARDDAYELLVDDDFRQQPGEIEDTTPLVHLRERFPQRWQVPNNTAAFGAFTRGPTGAVPDAGQQCLALIRGASDGRVEADWSWAGSGRIYGSVMLRVWAGLDGSSYLLLRFDSSAASGQRLRLFQGGTVLAGGNVAGASITAGGSSTLRVDFNGRILRAYVDDIFQFGHIVSSPGAGARGQPSEERHGIFTLADGNVCTGFRCYGPKRERETDITIGSRTYGWATAQVRSVREKDLDGEPTANLTTSKYLQTAHLSEADGNERAGGLKELFRTPNAVGLRFLTNCWREDILLASNAEGWVTFTRRGPWVSDGLKINTNLAGINFTPDNDLDPVTTSLQYLTAGDGAATVRDASSFPNWTTYETNANSGNAQWLHGTGTSRLRVSNVAFPISGIGPNEMEVLAKHLGNGDPLSLAVGDLQHDRPSHFAGNSVRIARAYLYETAAGLTLDSPTLIGFRDDLLSPATLSFTTGSLKTDAEGDVAGDGFNERYGWYEVDAVGGEFSFEMPDDGQSRYMPQFRIHGATARDVTVSGTDSIRDADYWIDELGDGTVLLQLAGTFASGVSVSTESSGGGVTVGEIAALLDQRLGSPGEMLEVTAVNGLAIEVTEETPTTDAAKFRGLTIANQSMTAVAGVDGATEDAGVWTLVLSNDLGVSVGESVQLLSIQRKVA